VAECEIQHFRLGGAPPYTALSYCWGSPTRTNSILLNGGRLDITQNLSEYLKNSTASPSEGPSRYLWIDAICINQADAVERSKQVLKMKQIYEQAESIDIWLGPGDRQIDDFMDRVNRITGKPRNRSQLSNTLNDNVHPFLQSLSPPSWNAVGKILVNPWWTRTWVIQEATTSGNDVSILCGHRRISFDVFDYICRYLLSEYVGRNNLLGPRQEIPWGPVITIFMTRDWRNEGKDLRKNTIDLYRILSDAKNHDAADPRDKVYSVLALAFDAGESDLQPDYTLPVREVYLNTARHILKRRKDLKLLYFCFNWHKPDGLPCWVPGCRA
jgi:hypothetical protein